MARYAAHPVGGGEHRLGELSSAPHLEIPTSRPGRPRSHRLAVVYRASVLPDIAAFNGWCSESSALSWIDHFERVLILTNAASFGVILRLFVSSLRIYNPEWQILLGRPYRKLAEGFLGWILF